MFSSGLVHVVLRPRVSSFSKWLYCVSSAYVGYQVVQPTVHTSRNEDYRRISGGQTKASIPGELVKWVLICQKELFPLPLAEGTYGSTGIHLWLQTKPHAGLQATATATGYRSPYPPGLVLHFKPPTLAFWPLSLPQTSLFPNTLYNDKDPPSPQLSSLILQIALAMSSLFFFLPALDSSRCFWIFSLFYLQ